MAGRPGYAVLPPLAGAAESEREFEAPRLRRRAPLCRRSWLCGLAAVAGATLLAVAAWHGRHAAAPLKQAADAEIAVLAEEQPWCANDVRPRNLWQPDPGRPIFVKILTYNLWWWDLFHKRHGNHRSAGKLIKKSGRPVPYDLMGFQECKDAERVLGDAELLDEYTAFEYTGNNTLCMAFRKATWSLEERGDERVAEDMKGLYGERAVQWMRLRHNSGTRVFFMNHHGPLPINTGGICGGKATAYNILRAITDHAKPGDGIVLLGDFNADGTSEEVKLLKQYLLHVYTGRYLNGIDNIFSNVDGLQVVSTKTLLGGGSDHDALNAIVEVGKPPTQQGPPAPARAPSTAAPTTKAPTTTAAPTTTTATTTTATTTTATTTTATTTTATTTSTTATTTTATGTSTSTTATTATATGTSTLTTATTTTATSTTATTTTATATGTTTWTTATTTTATTTTTTSITTNTATTTTATATGTTTSTTATTTTATTATTTTTTSITTNTVNFLVQQLADTMLKVVTTTATSTTMTTATATTSTATTVTVTTATTTTATTVTVTTATTTTATTVTTTTATTTTATTTTRTSTSTFSSTTLTSTATTTTAAAMRIRSPAIMEPLSVEEQPRAGARAATSTRAATTTPAITAAAPTTTPLPGADESGGSWQWWWPFHGGADATTTAAPTARRKPEHRTPTTTLPVGCDAKCVPGQELSTSCRASVLWYARFRFHSKPGSCTSAHDLVMNQCSGCFDCRLNSACPQEAAGGGCAEGDERCQQGPPEAKFGGEFTAWPVAERAPRRRWAPQSWAALAAALAAAGLGSFGLLLAAALARARTARAAPHELAPLSAGT